MVIPGRYPGLAPGRGPGLWPAQDRPADTLVSKLTTVGRGPTGRKKRDLMPPAGTKSR